MFAFRYGRSSDRPNVQFNHTTNKAIDRGHLPYFFCCDFIDFLKTRKFLSAACCETSPLRSRKVASVEQVGERFLARWRIEHVLFLDAPKARRGARRPIAPAAAWTPSPSYVTPCGPQSLRARDTPPKRHSPGRVPSKAWHRPVTLGICSSLRRLALARRCRSCASSASHSSRALPSLDPYRPASCRG